jgi:hypothetical protein
VRCSSALVQATIQSLRGGCGRCCNRLNRWTQLCRVERAELNVRLKLVRSVDKSVGVKFEKD